MPACCESEFEAEGEAGVVTWWALDGLDGLAACDDGAGGGSVGAGGEEAGWCWC